MHFFFFACYSFLPSVPPSCPHKELSEGLLTTTACSSSWTSIFPAPLAFQVQTPSVSGTCRGRKLRGSRISDTLVCRKHAKPRHMFQPLPSEDESEKAGGREHTLPPPPAETSPFGRKRLLLISTEENRHSPWWKHTCKSRGEPRQCKQRPCIKPAQCSWPRTWKALIFVGAVLLYHARVRLRVLP